MTAAAYALVRNGNPALASEVERDDARVVDVVLSWGEGADRTVLAVKHLDAGESLVVGEGVASGLSIPASVLGASEMRIIERRGDKTVLVPPAASRLRVDGWPRSESSIELGEGHVAEIEIGLFALRVTVVPAPKRVPLAMRVSRTLVGVILASAALHFGMVGAASFVSSRIGDDSSDADRNAQRYVATVIDATQEPETKPIDQTGAAQAAGGSSTAAEGMPGALGAKDAPPVHGRLQIAGDPAKPKTLSREQQLQDASQFGIIGLIGMMNTQSATGANATWGRDLNGADDATHFASFMDGIDDGHGSGGLTLTGPGEGGGGTPGGWIGMGHEGFGTLGRCVGQGCTDGIGWGRGPAKSGYQPKPIAMHYEGTTTSGGHLPPEVIQRIIRQSSGAFRNCYESGLRTNPELAGRVGVSFMIDRTGRVTYAADAGSDLPDQGVRSCIVSTFRGMSFPSPEGGSVSVGYGLSLSPGTT